jgi:hypothetical protein
MSSRTTEAGALLVIYGIGDGRTGTDENSRGSSRLIRLTLPIGAMAPAIAREAVARFGSVVDSGLQTHAQLLVSELVSRQLRRTSTDRNGLLALDISPTPRGLRIEVRDDERHPILVQPDPGEPTLGWELQLVAELADRWGLRHETHTTLWFELDR